MSNGYRYQALLFQAEILNGNSRKMRTHNDLEGQNLPLIIWSILESILHRLHWACMQFKGIMPMKSWNDLTCPGWIMLEPGLQLLVLLPGGWAVCLPPGRIARVLTRQPGLLPEHGKHCGGYPLLTFGFRNPTVCRTLLTAFT